MREALQSFSRSKRQLRLLLSQTEELEYGVLTNIVDYYDCIYEVMDAQNPVGSLAPVISPQHKMLSWGLETAGVTESSWP